ncbi:MAG: hypothetical protein WDO71_27180 [Bacteroidota bacterium]
MKMKLMLEKGASFSNMEKNSELPPEIENEFLNYIAEFEKQSHNPKYITVFDKIEKPARFKPVAEIPDEEIDTAWHQLSAYLNQYQISLDVCSPNIAPRELYRFTTEELFKYKMGDMNIPGMMHGFIYDEFHPDPVYDNTKTATDECIKYILKKEPMEWTHNFRKDNLRLNDRFLLSVDKLRNIVNTFKMAYDDLEITELSASNCSVNDKSSTVTGTYSLTAISNLNKHPLSGDWKVILELDEEFGYWYITEVKIAGINF